MAELIYNEHYFEMANPNIYENEELREPQIQGYFKVYDHFVVKNKQTHAIIVLPTGVGKTGLMGILPFHICKGRALIVRAGPCSPLRSFSLIRKTELWRTNKPPALRVVRIALALCKKPPMI